MLFNEKPYRSHNMMQASKSFLPQIHVFVCEYKGHWHPSYSPAQKTACKINPSGLIINAEWSWLLSKLFIIKYLHCSLNKGYCETECSHILNILSSSSSPTCFSVYYAEPNTGDNPLITTGWLAPPGEKIRLDIHEKNPTLCQSTALPKVNTRQSCHHWHLSRHPSNLLIFSALKSPALGLNSLWSVQYTASNH